MPTFMELSNTVDELADGETGSHKQPSLLAPRSGASPETSYDAQVMPATDVATFSPGIVRQNWQPSPRAIFSGIASLKSNTAQQIGSQTYAYKAGILSNPTTASGAFKVIPDMSVSLKTTAAVGISFSGTFKTASAADTASFALFRDNQQIGRTFQDSSAAIAQPFTINLNVIDTPPAGYHVYDARWAAGTNTATAVLLSRTIQAQDLRPV